MSIKTPFDRIVFIINTLLTFLSFVLVFMQVFHIADTGIGYMSLFSITAFLNAYLYRENDLRYRRNMQFGIMFLVLMILFN